MICRLLWFFYAVFVGRGLFLLYLHPMNMRAVSASWWSKKRLRPVSSVAMAAISSSESAKSNMSTFCCIRSMWVDLGMMMTPRWINQRRAICTMLFPYLLPISASIEFVKKPLRPSVSGLHDMMRVPNSFAVQSVGWIRVFPLDSQLEQSPCC